MDVYIYSDESGVFDKEHNDFFVFGGVMFFGKEERDKWCRKYINAEKTIKRIESIPKAQEAKAARISNRGKDSLFRSLNGAQKFSIIIDQKSVLPRIFQSKKDKQRYLDYAYKIGVKRCFEHLFLTGKLDSSSVERLHFYVDEHTTATNGIYELREGLEREFKIGTYNRSWDCFYPPIFENLLDVQLRFCNSASVTLVRAADIVANKMYYMTTSGKIDEIRNKVFTTRLP